MYYTQQVEGYTLILKKEEGKEAKIVTVVDGEPISEDELVKLINSYSWNLISSKIINDAKFFLFSNDSEFMIVKYYYVAECAILTEMPDSVLSAASKIIGYKYITKKKMNLDKYDKVTKKGVAIVSEYMSNI